MVQHSETLRPGKRIIRIHFDSTSEAADYLVATPSRWGNAMARSGGSRSHDWDFGLGEHGVWELARTGWSAGAKDLSARLAAHLPARDTTAKWRYDVAGERPDVGRYLSGSPDCMMRHGHPKGRRPVITLFYNNWISSAITATQAANLGAAVVSMVDQLENSGRRVEVVCGSVIEHSKFGTIMMSATWRVKAAEDPLDLATLAFGIAHPGASRRFGWSLWGRTDIPADPSFGMRRNDITEEDLTDPAPGAIILQGLTYGNKDRCKTLDDALAFAAEMINKSAGEELVTVNG